MRVKRDLRPSPVVLDVKDADNVVARSDGKDVARRRVKQQLTSFSAAGIDFGLWLPVAWRPLVFTPEGKVVVCNFKDADLAVLTSRGDD